jgi:hypothetical protein
LKPTPTNLRKVRKFFYTLERKGWVGRQGRGRYFRKREMNWKLHL